MRLDDVRPRDETFTFIDHDNGDLMTVFNASAVLRACLQRGDEPVSVALTPDIVEIVQTKRFINPDKLANIRSIELGKRGRPVIMVAMPNGTHVLIDGTHRVFKAHAEGHKGFLAYLVPEEHWRPWVINDIPPDFAAHIRDDTLATAKGPVEPKTRGTPISELSGRPGHPGYDAFKRIAESWGCD